MPLTNNILKKPSVLLLLFAFCFSFWFMDLWRPWHRHKMGDHPFVWDVAQYYSYLPGTFIYNYDFTYQEDLNFFMNNAPLGGKMPKTTYGMSVLYSPFFAIGYKIALNQKSPLTGYSEPFSTAIHFGSIFYGLLGLIFLRNFLIKFYSEITTAVTLAIVFFGTTLFCYVVAFSEMTHGYLFMLFTAQLLMTFHWYKKPTYFKSILLGLIMGLACLIRPTEVFAATIFVFWMIDSFSSLKERLFFFLQSYKHVLLMALVAVALWVPQFLFWKYKTGSYFYFSYPGERFFWNDPQIINILFSYRKGWFVYSPLIALAFIGFFFMKDELKKSRIILVAFILITIYVLSCWWDWHFGGCFGARGFTQYTAFLALPIAALVNHLTQLQNKFTPHIQMTFFAIIFSGICLNIGQTYQYNSGLIHYDSMNSKSYWLVFNKYKLSGQETEKFWKSLKVPNYKKMREGERN